MKYLEGVGIGTRNNQIFEVMWIRITVSRSKKYTYNYSTTARYRHTRWRHQSFAEETAVLSNILLVN